MKKNAKNLKRVSLASAAILTAFALPTVVCPNQSTTVHADEVTGSQESATGQDSLDSMKNQVEQDKTDVDNANQAIQDQQEVVNQAQQEVDKAESQFHQALNDEVKSEEWNRFAQGQKEEGDQRVERDQEAVNQAQQEVDKATQEEAVKQSDFDNIDKSYQEAQQNVTDAENSDSTEQEAVNQAQQEYEQAQQEASQAEEDYKTAVAEGDKKQAELEKTAKETEEAVNKTDSEIIQKEKEYKQDEENRQQQAKKTAEDYYNLSKTKNPRVELPEGYDINNKEHTAVINFNANIPTFDKNVNASAEDFNNIVDIQNPTDSQIKEINEFIAQIVNDVRSQVGVPRVGVTTSSIKEAEAIAKDNETHNSVNSVYLGSTAGFDVVFDGISYGVGVSNAFQTPTDLKKKSASMADIKEDLFNAIMKIFFSINARGNLSKAETLIKNGYSLGAHYAFYENNGDPISQLVIAFCWSDDNPYDSGDDNAKYMDNYRKLGMAQGGDVAKAVQKVYDDDTNAYSKAFVSKTELKNLETKRDKQAEALDEATNAYQNFYDEASSKAFDNIRATKEKEAVASVKYNKALKALSQKQQEKALEVAKAKQALAPIEAKREEAKKALDIAKQNTAKAQFDLKEAKGDLSEAVIFKELKDKVAKDAEDDLAQKDEIVDKAIAECNSTKAKYDTEKAKLPELEEAYKLALDKYNKDKDLYDTLAKAQEENNKHNQDVPTPSEDKPSKGEDTPAPTPSEDKPSKGEDTPAPTPSEDKPSKG
ncbi:SEC10/PgrA surface exclusion domain-containing protein, partial [Streptococcus equinus]